MSEIKEQFVSYEIALKLKELGFDEECFGLYKNEILFRDYETFQWNEFLNCIKAPLWQQVIDWFRKKYLFEVEPVYNKSFEKYQYVIYKKFSISLNEEMSIINNGSLFITYEEAREKAILKAIELCQKEK